MLGILGFTYEELRNGVKEMAKAAAKKKTTKKAAKKKTARRGLFGAK